MAFSNRESTLADIQHICPSSICTGSTEHKVSSENNTEEHAHLPDLHSHILIEYSIVINNDNTLECTISKPLPITGKEQRDRLGIEFCEQKHTTGVSD